MPYVPISTLMCTQTKNLLTDLNQTIAYGLPILEADRAKVESISVNLRDALNQSRDRSVLPTDLETAASFVEIVANLSKNNGLFDDNTQEIEKTQQKKVFFSTVLYTVCLWQGKFCCLSLRLWQTLSALSWRRETPQRLK